MPGDSQKEKADQQADWSEYQKGVWPRHSGYLTEAINRIVEHRQS